MLPLFAVAAVGLPFAKRRRIAWLLGYAACAFVLYEIKFEELGSRAALLHVTFVTLALAGLTAMAIRDAFVIGGALSMDAEDWQKEFDEANQLAKQRAKKAKESNGS